MQQPTGYGWTLHGNDWCCHTFQWMETAASQKIDKLFERFNRMYTQYLDYIQAIRMLNFDWKPERSEKLTAVCFVKPVLVLANVSYSCYTLCVSTNKHTNLHTSSERTQWVCMRYTVFGWCVYVCVFLYRSYSMNVLNMWCGSWHTPAATATKRYTHEMNVSLFFWRESSTSSTSQANAFHIQHLFISVFCMRKRNVNI